MKNRGSRKSKIGLVVSNGMNKSIVVSVERLLKHSLYRKYYKKTSNFMAHDEENQCEVGDKVKIVETRPLSKMKRWRLAEILDKAQ